MSPETPRGTVESRRFRTWEPDATVRPERAWRIVLKYGLTQNLRSWWVVLPLVAALVGLVALLGAATVEWGSAEEGGGAYVETLSAFVGGILAIGAAFVFLVGTPLFSEDLRFNAPLFYFSKPLRIRDYVLGKASQLALIVAATTLLPILALLVIGALLAPANATPPTEAFYLDPADWKTRTLDTVGDWAYAAAVLLPGVVAVSAFVVSATLLASVYTRRAWHSAMALVAVLGGWGILGAIASETSRSAFQHIFGPGGWFYLLTVLPLDLRFDPQARDAVVAPESTLAWPAILTAYVLVVGLSVLFYALTVRRLRRQEAWL